MTLAIRALPLAFPLLLLAACNSGNESGSKGTTHAIPENQGMREGTGVGDNAPGGSYAPASQPSGTAATGNPAGAMNQPPTGSP